MRYVNLIANSNSYGNKLRTRTSVIVRNVLMVLLRSIFLPQVNKTKYNFTTQYLLS